MQRNQQEASETALSTIRLGEDVLRNELACKEALEKLFGIVWIHPAVGAEVKSKGGHVTPDDFAQRGPVQFVAFDLDAVDERPLSGRKRSEIGPFEVPHLWPRDAGVNELPELNMTF